jgi:hypothetical protein
VELDPNIRDGARLCSRSVPERCDVKRFCLAIVIIGAVFSTIPAETFAQQRGWGWYEGRPYGHFCPQRKWGGPYGVRKPVATVDEARQVIEQYFGVRRMSVTVGKIEERKWFFLAEILDKDGTVVDETIVDRRTGRIRSIH